ncbi:hypothetical protein G6736_00440 [Polynucleobacter paneuropaeus]|nr:hypothetical protein [Polynucleobacter paneuropaeus]MBT8537990.1 hypothetical protein [Polynucleobacter paneuropaeus]
MTTNSIFGLVSYFKWGLLIGVGVWALILYRLIAKDGLTANVVGILILIGIVSLEGDVATDLNGVINHALFYFEYAAAGLLALLLFPNLHDRVIKSAALRLIEADRQFIRGESNLIEFDDQTITSLLTLENQAAQVEPAIYGLMSFLKSLQIQIRGYSFGQKQNYKSLLEALDVIHHSISQSQAIEMDQLAHSTEILRGHKVAATLKDLAEYWNAQCLV